MSLTTNNAKNTVSFIFYQTRNTCKKNNNVFQVSQPFELVGMDLISKLTETKNGNMYICTMVDYLTKWPQAYPLKSKNAEEVMRCILKFVHQFEAPKRILTDQGKELVNNVSNI